MIYPHSIRMHGDDDPDIERSAGVADDDAEILEDSDDESGSPPEGDEGMFAASTEDAGDDPRPESTSDGRLADEFETFRAAAEAELAQLWESVESLRDDAAHDRIERLESSAEGLDAELDRLRERFEHDVAELSERLASVEDAVDRRGEADADALREDVESLGSQVDELDADLGELREELQSHKRTSERERESLAQARLSDFANRMLVVLDEIDRTLERGELNERARRDLDVIRRKFEQKLTQGAIDPIDTSGSFDPSYHQLAGRVDEPGAERDEIVEVLQKGYELEGKPIRPAVVRVASGDE